MSGSKYLGWCLPLTLLIVAGVAAINYIADPCGIYHYGESWDWIHSRPETLDEPYIFKARAVENASADVLFMGSSRTAEGLDPHNPVISGHAYNLGLASSSIYEQWRYLQHACAAHLPNTVVVGVDMDGFPASRMNNDSFSEDRLLVRPDGTPTPFLTRTFADLAPSLLSLSTLNLSLTTLMAQGSSSLSFKDGFEADAPKLVEHLDLTKNVYAATDEWLRCCTTAIYRAPDGSAPQMDAFEHMVTLCATKHIHLIVFLQPLHALMLDKDTQNWDVYCAWERELISRMEAHPGLRGEFWDFTSYNSMSTEPLPDPAKIYSDMRYYWEGSHYRMNVGDMILRRIFNAGGPVDFGRMVTNSTVDQDLQRLAAEKRAWHDHQHAVLIHLASDRSSAAPLPLLFHGSASPIGAK